MNYNKWKKRVRQLSGSLSRMQVELLALQRRINHLENPYAAVAEESARKMLRRAEPSLIMSNLGDRKASDTIAFRRLGKYGPVVEDERDDVRDAMHHAMRSAMIYGTGIMRQTGIDDALHYAWEHRHDSFPISDHVQLRATDRWLAEVQEEIAMRALKEMNE